jgi:hypothetical protein
MLVPKGRAIFLFLGAAFVVCLLMISSPPSLLMTASAEYYFDFMKYGAATFFMNAYLCEVILF